VCGKTPSVGSDAASMHKLHHPSRSPARYAFKHSLRGSLPQPDERTLPAQSVRVPHILTKE